MLFNIVCCTLVRKIELFDYYMIMDLERLDLKLSPEYLINVSDRLPRSLSTVLQRHVGRFHGMKLVMTLVGRVLDRRMNNHLTYEKFLEFYLDCFFPRLANEAQNENIKHSPQGMKIFTIVFANRWILFELNMEEVTPKQVQREIALLQEATGDVERLSRTPYTGAVPKMHSQARLRQQPHVPRRPTWEGDFNIKPKESTTVPSIKPSVNTPAIEVASKSQSIEKPQSVEPPEGARQITEEQLEQLSKEASKEFENQQAVGPEMMTRGDSATMSKERDEFGTLISDWPVGSQISQSQKDPSQRDPSNAPTGPQKSTEFSRSPGSKDSPEDPVLTVPTTVGSTQKRTQGQFETELSQNEANVKEPGTVRWRSMGQTGQVSQTQPGWSTKELSDKPETEQTVGQDNDPELMPESSDAAGAASGVPVPIERQNQQTLPSLPTETMKQSRESSAIDYNFASQAVPETERKQTTQQPTAMTPGESANAMSGQQEEPAESAERSKLSTISPQEPTEGLGASERYARSSKHQTEPPVAPEAGLEYQPEPSESEMAPTGVPVPIERQNQQTLPSLPTETMKQSRESSAIDYDFDSQAVPETERKQTTQRPTVMTPGDSSDAISGQQGEPVESEERTKLTNIGSKEPTLGQTGSEQYARSSKRLTEPNVAPDTGLEYQPEPSESEMAPTGVPVPIERQNQQTLPSLPADTMKQTKESSAIKYDFGSQDGRSDKRQTTQDPTATGTNQKDPTLQPFGAEMESEHDEVPIKPESEAHVAPEAGPEYQPEPLETRVNETAISGPVARTKQATFGLPSQNLQQTQESSAIKHKFNSYDARSAGSAVSEVSFDKENLEDIEKLGGSMSKADKEKAKTREKWVPSPAPSSSCDCEDSKCSEKRLSGSEVDIAGDATSGTQLEPFIGMTGKHSDGSG